MLLCGIRRDDLQVVSADAVFLRIIWLKRLFQYVNIGTNPWREGIDVPARKAASSKRKKASKAKKPKSPPINRSPAAFEKAFSGRLGVRLRHIYSAKSRAVPRCRIPDTFMSWWHIALRQIITVLSSRSIGITIDSIEQLSMVTLNKEYELHYDRWTEEND